MRTDPERSIDELQPGFDLVWAGELAGESATLRLGRALAEMLPAGSMVALIGPLGAGKTHLVKGLAAGLCGTDPAVVRSPTFTLLHSFRGGGRVLHHMDLCRIEDEAAVPSDVLDALSDAAAVCAVEWADMHPGLWPERVVVVMLDYGADATSRSCRVAARGLGRIELELGK